MTRAQLLFLAAVLLRCAFDCSPDEAIERAAEMMKRTEKFLEGGK